MKVEANVTSPPQVQVTVSFVTTVENLNKISAALQKAREGGFFGPVWDLQKGIEDVTRKINQVVCYEPEVQDGKAD